MLMLFFSYPKFNIIYFQSLSSSLIIEIKDPSDSENQVNRNLEKEGQIINNLVRKHYL
jgi:hypothetical protein